MLKNLVLVAVATVIAGTAAAPAFARDWHHHGRHHPVCHMDRHHHRICR